ncbi:MAG: AAA family ATPase [Chlorobium sp.]
MIIEKLEFWNYRCFEHLEIDFDPKLTVIVAPNGAGKTTILDGITVVFGTYLGAFDESKGSGFIGTDIRLVRNSLTGWYEAAPPVKTVAKICTSDKKDISISRQNNSTAPNSKTSIKDAKPLTQLAKMLQEGVRKQEPINLQILTYYGTGRIWKETKLIDLSKSTLSQSRTIGYRDCMNPSSSFKLFAYWFKQLTLSILQAKESEKYATESTTKLLIDLHDAVKSAVDKAISFSGWSDIRYDGRFDEITVSSQDKIVIPVSMVSDGIKSIVSMAADIAFRCVKLNPHLLDKAVEKTKGIVLIDEIDMHLHPQWQQIVVPAFIEAFPNIQFIVTTHSPQVLTTVPPESIRILRENHVEHVTFSLGAQSNDLLYMIQHVDPRPQNIEIVQKLNKYAKLVNHNEWGTQDALKLWSELCDWGGEYEKELRRLEIDVRIREYERSINEKNS